jgi:hypothetical protein
MYTIKELKYQLHIAKTPHMKDRIRQYINILIKKQKLAQNK